MDIDPVVFKLIGAVGTLLWLLFFSILLLMLEVIAGISGILLGLYLTDLRSATFSHRLWVKVLQKGVIALGMVSAFCLVLVVPRVLINPFTLESVIPFFIQQAFVWLTISGFIIYARQLPRILRKR